MSQISYWKQVKRLHDIYEYHLESTPSLEERDILVKSIKEYIVEYEPGFDLVDIYQWVYKLIEKHRTTIPDALMIWNEAKGC